MLLKRYKLNSSATEIFPLTDTLIDFDDTITKKPDPQRRKDEMNRAPSKRSIAQKWFIAIALTGLYLMATIVFYELKLIKKTTILALLGMLAIMIAVFFVIFQSRLNQLFHEKRMKLPIISSAFICMLVVFYLEPATQIIFTPFAFIAIAYGMYRVTTAKLVVLLIAVFSALALIITLHYRQTHNLALLQLEVIHFATLFLSLPVFIFLIRKVHHLQRVLNLASRKIKYIQADAKRDVLIDCYNRRYMVAALEEHKQIADENGTALCLAVIDLDHFKRINDEVGHLAGDEVLKTFSNVAQENVRTSDIFGRYGGEEFLLIFPDTSLLPALNTSERIRAQIEIYPWKAELQNRVSVSIGVTQYIPGESVLELFSRTDTAMYLAKQGGRNQVVVEEPVPICNDPD